MQQQLLEFDFDIRHKEGKENTVVDALSRNTVDESGTMRAVSYTHLTLPTIYSV